MEAATTVAPKENFLHDVQVLCKKNGSVFIIDEMITGFRWHLQGAQTYFNIEPDLCTFGKAMANGFAVAALAGKREIMKLGGILEEGTERIFLTSTTHGAECPPSVRLSRQWRS
jgi:glutamate-1-semialdehyde 2,1-aminomutase